MIPTKSSVFRFANLTVREREFSIEKAGAVQRVEPKAFRLLLILLRNQNKLIAKEELLNAVWADAAVTENSLARNIALLRRLLDDDPRNPRYIETVSSIGYRFVCPVEAREDREESLEELDPLAILTPNGRVKSVIHQNVERDVTPEDHKQRWLVPSLIGVAVVALALVSFLSLKALHRARIAPRAAWVRITNFPEAATSPALSPDGHIIAFIGGPDPFVSHGQIYVKILPDGQPVQLTHDDLMKSAPTFSPDGSRIAYTAVDSYWHWNTWVVPVLGGEPQEMLPNAEALTWLDAQHVVYSEHRSEFHVGVVTSTESRTAERELYLPASVEAMAHHAWVSPDHKWMLVAERDHVGWKPCHVMPFDGSSTGWVTGPNPARCRTAAWSPDGKMMYLGADAGDGFHIWQQKFPRGVPKQITFGPTEEEGIAIAPDGRSLITSAGFIESTVWVHDANGDRQVSGEGFATVPGLGHPDDSWVHHVFSPDGKRLYYLLRKPGSRAHRSGELWMADLDSGHTEAVLPGVLMGKFDILPDGDRVAFESEHEYGVGQVWVAWLDHRKPPKLLTTAPARLPHFGPGGDIYIGVREGEGEFTYKVGPDEVPRKLEPPFPGVVYISPHGQWLLDGFAHLTARPGRGGPPVPVCDYCDIGWGPGGGVLYLMLKVNGEIGGGRAVAVGLPPGQDLPELPASGLSSIEDFKGLNVLANIDLTGKAGFVPGPTTSIYAYARRTTQRNLFKIPLN